MPTADLKQLPETVELHLVDIREIDAPKGMEPIHWLLLTSHMIEALGQARLMLDFYRKRWIIEEFFRTLKSAGFRIEDAKMSDPAAFMNFAALAAIAAVTVTQMVRARDNPSGQLLADAFDPDDQPLLMAICKDYEGETPTERQKNPHPPDTLAFATWSSQGSELGQAITASQAQQLWPEASRNITPSNTERKWHVELCESNSPKAGGLPDTVAPFLGLYRASGHAREEVALCNQIQNQKRQ